MNDVARQSRKAASQMGEEPPAPRVEETAEYKGALQEMKDRVARQALALSLQAAEFEALVSLSAALRQAVTIDDVIGTLLDVAVHSLEADCGAVLLLQEGTLAVAGLQGVSGALHERYPLLRNDPLWQAIETGRPFPLDLAGGGGSVASQMCQSLAPHMATVTMVPLRAARETAGLLELGFIESRPLQAYSRPLIAMAEIGGNALQRVRVMDTLEQMIRDRTRDLAALYEVTTMASQPLDTHSILERMLDKALEVVGGAAGIIHLLSPDHEPPELAISCAIPSGLAEGAQSQGMGRILWDRVLKKKEPVIVADWPAASSGSHPAPLEGFPAYIGEPIVAAGHLLGVLSVFGEAIQDFSAEDIALLAAIANHLGAAVEGARLRHRAEEAAVMEERQRLAREMHDSVTQSLYSLTLFAEAARDSARIGDLAKTQRYLERLSATGQQALKEMRLLIYQLHPLALTQDGLAGALHQRLQAVERRAGVEAQILLETPLMLSSRVEAGLYRIAQEALNNVLKHANATQVTVRIGVQKECVTLEVTDNGHGFDLDTVRDRAGLGLASIQERAEGLRGSVQISSTPGAGTTIRVLVPLENQNGASHLEQSL